MLKAEDLPNYSYDDYKTWEGDWELIDGMPFAMTPAPVKQHQLLVGYLFAQIVSDMDDCPECEVLIDEDWKLDSNTVLNPDVAIVCGDDNPSYIAKTPEVIFEVLSPSTARRDEGLKFELYQSAGVKYYTLVYPDDRLARIYRHDGEVFKKVAECDSESFSFDNISCPFELDFSQVFKHLKNR